MADDIDESTLIGLLKAAELSAMKYCNEEALNHTAPIIGQEALDAKTECSLWNGIITRLQFRLNLYRGYATMSDSNRLVNDNKCLDASLTNFENCRKLLATMISSKDINEGVLWPVGQENLRVGNIKSNAKKANLTDVERCISTLAFDADLAAEVMPHAPPHAFDPVKFSETCNTFKNPLMTLFLFYVHQNQVYPVCRNIGGPVICTRNKQLPSASRLLIQLTR